MKIIRVKHEYLFEATKFKAESIRSFGIALTVPFGSMMLKLFLEPVSLTNFTAFVLIKLLLSVILVAYGSNIIGVAQNTIEKGDSSL